MNENSLIAMMVRSLPDQVLPWVAAALRQDPLIWRCLQDIDFREQAFSRLQPGRVELWTPAALALAALELPHTPERLSADIHYPLESRLRRKLAQVFEGLAEERRGGQDPIPGAGDLAQAGLLALALRERRRLLGTWAGLLDDLENVGLPFLFWRTPLACLFGLAPDPMEMLAALLPAGSVEEGQAGLALHALLANPMPPERQEDLLQAFLVKRLPADGVTILNCLADQRPELAARLARRLLEGGWDLTPRNRPGANLALDPLDDLATLARLVQGAQAQALAGDQAQALPLIGEAREIAIHLQSGLAAGMARFLQKQDPPAACAAWEEALRLAPAEAGARLGLVESLLDAGRVDEARRWLEQEIDGPEADLPLHAMLAIRLAVVGGEIERAREEALHLFEKMEDRTRPESQIQLPSLQFAAAFASLLGELGMLDEAARAARLAQFSWPADVDLMALEGQACMAAGQAQAAVQALQMAVALAPNREDLRRTLAGAWEACGEWQAALEQRTWVVEAAPAPAAAGQDLRLLANCALHAGAIQPTIDACQAALALDVEDGLAHQLLGQALEARGDLQAAHDQYVLATRYAPTLVEPWLLLARTQHQAAQASQALETLRAAAQALPESAEIHLALGEAYLEDGMGHGLPAPTQALACFQQAAVLAPADVHVGLRLGQTLYGLGHLLEARQTLEGAYREQPGYPGLAHAYALALVALDEPAAALPVFAEFADLPEYAHDALLHLVHARALLRAGGEPRQASAALKRVLSLDPGCAEAQALFAEALLAAGDLPAAMQAFEAALETSLADDPTWKARLSLGLGNAALSAGQQEIALVALQEAAQADPHDPAIARRLAEASYTAGLSDHALQAARMALRLAPDDLATLDWFAEQAMRWVDERGDAHGPGTALAFSGTLTPSAVAQLRSETLNALTRALQFDPQRASLLVRLARVQMSAGDTNSALDHLRQVIASPAASPDDLYQAATGLLALDDAAGAVACLERAIHDFHSAAGKKTGAQPAVSGEQPGLLALQILLAQGYEKAGNAPAALATLEIALSAVPDDLALYRAKARLLKAQNRTAETMACLETAIELSVGSAGGNGSQDLCYEAACLLRAAGDLPKALCLAEQALASSDPASPGPYTLPAQVLAAELAHALLLPERARAFLGAPPERAGSGEPTGGLFHWRYFCLAAELALDGEDPAQAAELFARASEALAGAVRADGEGYAGSGLESSPPYEILEARLQGARARLCLLHGDKEDALNMIDEASRRVLSAPSGRGNLPLAGQLSLGEAALRLGLWETAMRHFQAALDAAPKEPLSHLSLARALVLRAEMERLYTPVDAIRHAPGAASLDRLAYAAFEQAINTAHQQIGKWLTTEGRPEEAPRAPSSNGRRARRSAPYRRSDVIQAQTMVSRWRARGQAIFQPGPQSTQALSATLAILPPTAEDVAAQISALRLSAALIASLPDHERTNRPPTTPLGIAAPATIAIQAARAYPQHPRVLIELALALAGQEENGVNALHAAQGAVNAMQPADNLWPVGSALLARLAYAAGDLPAARAAISGALACWGEEPRWQALAAEIEMSGGNVNAAISHLESAAGLEPGYLPHFLALGQAYLRLAGVQSSENRQEDRMGRDGGGDEERPVRQAVHILEEACRLAPGDPRAWLALAGAQRSGGLLDRAAESAQRAIELSPGEVQARLARAEIALLAGDAQAAYDWAAEALRMDGVEHSPLETDASLLAARALNRLDRPAEALQMLEKVLGKNTQHLLLALERVQLLRRLHGAEVATQALQRLVAEHPGEVQVLAPLAFALAEAGQTEAAIRAAQAALQGAAAGGPAAEESGTHGSAAGGLETRACLVSSTSVDYAGLQALLGRLLGGTGQLDGAIHHLHEAIRLAPRRLDPYLELGQALQERRQHAQALQIYSQATSIAPRDPRPYFQAGLALKDSKDYLAAESMLRRAAALAPNDLNIHRQLGAVVALNLVHNRAGARRMNA